MAQINYISHEVNQKGEFYASVARRMEIGPRTASKYANQEKFNTRPKQKLKARVMDPVKPILDKWIKGEILSPLIKKTQLLWEIPIKRAIE